MAEFVRYRIEDEENKFRAYLEIQMSGRTNMFMSHAVIALAKSECDVIMTKADIVHIMRYYNDLLEEYI